MRRIMMEDNERSLAPVFDKSDNGDLTKLQEFYKKEELFIERLFDFEKEKAKDVGNVLITIIREFVEKDMYPNMKYYLISLTALISKRMQRIHSHAGKSFSFNTTILSILDESLVEEKADEFLSEIVEFFDYITATKEQPKLHHQTVNEVIRYIEDHVKDDISVEGLARKFDVSTSHLSRIFREHAGVTLVEYINIKKVQESQYYLRFSNEKISDISDEFNFCNQSYYTRIFKKYTGYTPRKFKNDMKGGYFNHRLTQ